MIGRRFDWLGPQPSGDGEQVANAHEAFVDLTPVSQAAADQTRTDWAATLPPYTTED